MAKRIKTQHMKIDGVHLEMVASISGFYEYIDKNTENLGFTSDQFNEGFRDNMFSDGTLSSRFTQKWCEQVIAKEGHAANEFWDKSRPYYPAILAFMKDYELDTIRFDCDW